MSSFTKHPPLQPLPDGRRFKVMEDFRYYVGKENSDEYVDIPKGYISDGASTPPIFYSIVGGRWGRYGYAAILHDYILQFKLYSYSKADRIMLEAMKVLGVSWWKRHLMYRGLRLWHIFKK